MRYIDHGYNQIMTFHRSPYFVITNTDMTEKEGRWLIYFTADKPSLLPLAWELS